MGKQEEEKKKETEQQKQVVMEIKMNELRLNKNKQTHILLPSFSFISFLYYICISFIFISYFLEYEISILVSYG